MEWSATRYDVRKFGESWKQRFERKYIMKQSKRL